MPSRVTLQQQLKSGISHHQAGRLAEAERIYRQVLAQHPDHADALNLLGVLVGQAGRRDAAVELIRRAIRIKPDYAEAHGNLGIALKDKGQLDEAIAAYRHAIALRPNYTEAYYNLGNALKGKGQLDEAIAAYRQAIALRPNFPEAHCNLGIALKDKGRFDEAIAAYRRAIALRPNYAEAHCNLASALKDTGQLDEAITAYRQAISLRPNFAEAYSNLGNALTDRGQLDEAIAAFRQAITLNPNLPAAQSNLGIALTDRGHLDEAIAACRQAIALRPNYAEAHYNLGNALAGKGQLDEAVAAFRQAIALNPNIPEAHSNLGNALRDKGQLDEAIAACCQAIALRPNYAEAHNNLSFALLARGDFQRGWEEYEWRSKCKDFPSRPRNFTQPQWDGSSLEARTLLLHTEQGFGDAIQFIRYVPLVAQRGGRIIVECQAQLQRLFQNMAGRCQIVAEGQPLPGFDLRCSLLSLPRIFRTTLDNIPQIVPYLSPEPALVDAWSRTLGAPDGQLRVGLAWAGNPRFKGDRTRSLNLQQLAPLAATEGVKFYGVQKGPAGEQAKKPPVGLELVDLGPELNDFADTAAVMSLMDLIITTDTSVPHLAGALGRSVWVMLQLVPDFRWLRDRTDSPWYPTMRLFRQPSRGDWDSVITRVADALSQWTRNRA
jgi:tetratricopeptide (TPR) repeat protein